MGLEAIGLTFGSGGDSESVFNSESDPDLENEIRCFEIGVGSGFLGWGFLSVTGVDGTERGWERRHIQGRGTDWDRRLRGDGGRLRGERERDS